MSKSCSSFDLQYLNDRYEYRVLAVSIMDHILVESKLSDGAKMLWMILYRGAGLTKDMKCEASVSFLKNMTGKSESTLWRLIKELRENNYLKVITREGEDGKNLPNIYGPRLPMTIISKIKKTATPREVVSDQLGYDYVTASCRDYQNSDEITQVITNSQESNDLIVNEMSAEQSENDCESDLQLSNNNTLVIQQKELTEPSMQTEKYKNRTENGYVKNETGESIKNDIQYTNPPTEVYTKIMSHSRDQWKMYPHIRTIVKQRLLKMGIEYNQSEKLIREIDWTIHFGSMGDWPIQKAINVCLKLIGSNEWATPRLSL